MAVLVNSHNTAVVICECLVIQKSGKTTQLFYNNEPLSAAKNPIPTNPNAESEIYTFRWVRKPTAEHLNTLLNSLHRATYDSLASGSRFRYNQIVANKFYGRGAPQKISKVSVESDKLILTEHVADLDDDIFNLDKIEADLSQIINKTQLIDINQASLADQNLLYRPKTYKADDHRSVQHRLPLGEGVCRLGVGSVYVTAEKYFNDNQWCPDEQFLQYQFMRVSLHSDGSDIQQGDIQRVDIFQDTSGMEFRRRNGEICPFYRVCCKFEEYGVQKIGASL